MADIAWVCRVTIYRRPFDFRAPAETPVQVYGFGPDAATSSAHLLAALRAMARHQPAAATFIDAGPEDSMPRPVRLDRGYVLADNDDLWAERIGHHDPIERRREMDLLDAMWADESMPAPQESADTTWMGTGRTARAEHRLESYGDTPQDSLAAMAATWTRDYAPANGADPGYLHDVMAERLVFVQVPTSGSATCIDGRWNRPVMAGDDPCMDDTWETTRPRAPSPRR